MLPFFLRANAQVTKPNILFIIFDDLNDYTTDLGGQPQIQTPAIDRIDSLGICFTDAYANAPGCAPSRTSFLSGKDLAYTKVYNNTDYQGKFRLNFSDSLGNGTVFTIPQILKDSGGYFTFAINKVFHSSAEDDFDKSAPHDMCSKEQSWNRDAHFEEADWFTELTETQYAFGGTFPWGSIPDSLEPNMLDYMIADTAIQFINAYADGTANSCGRPFFLAIGLHAPHDDRYIPEKYFPPYYVPDLYEEPFVIPYNVPVNNVPWNGIVMPPQPPQGMYADYDSLPVNGPARDFAGAGHVYDDVTDYVNGLTPLPAIAAGLSNEEKIEILDQTVFADYMMSYMAASQYGDAQVGRVLDALESHPALFNNTIIILTSDHGYSLGEKKHWTKWAMWETDLRIPLVIVWPGKLQHQSCNQPVSLLDLFPTILDMADVPYPHFPDGSDYPDGNSLVPLVNNPSLGLDDPSLSSFKPASSVGSCFPQYSVRTGRFHLIRYTPNNDGSESANYCDPDADTLQLELYDIGTNHETDPNEWNNLAYNPDYKPVVDYLESFIPGAANYLSKPCKAVIDILSAPGCVLSDTSTVSMHAFLFSPQGIPVPDDSLQAYTLTWTNNLNAETATGPDYTFPLASVDAATFASGHPLFIYLTVTDTASGKTVAIDLKTLYINPGSEPAAQFEILTYGTETQIQDYQQTGVVSNVLWDWGDGTQNSGNPPTYHIYADTGTYTITLTLFYGNSDSCFVRYTNTITLHAAAKPQSDFVLYPNPANNMLYIKFFQSTDIENIRIFNTLGQEVQVAPKSRDVDIEALDVSALFPGIYYLRIQFPAKAETGKFEIFR